LPFGGDKIVPEFGLGGKVQYTMSYLNPDAQWTWDATVGVALKNKKADDILKGADKTNSQAHGLNGKYGGVATTPQAKIDAGKKKDFYGLDIGAKAALILGIELNLKIGFDVDEK
jgi:hypothetical protein